MSQCIMPKRGRAVGNGLNVYAAASVGALPSGVDGDIGIITEDGITSVAVDNEAIASPEEGMVRIETTANNGAPVFINPTTKLYPWRATQYLSGIWVGKDMRVRYGGSWVNPFLYLYYIGNQCDAITGGFSTRAWAAVSGYAAKAPTITDNGNSVTIYLTAATNSSGVYELVNNIDLTPYTTLSIDSSATGSNCGADLNIVSRTAPYYMTSRAAAVDLMGVRNIRSIDVTALNSSYDICVGNLAFTSNGEVTVTMYALYLK